MPMIAVQTSPRAVDGVDVQSIAIALQSSPLVEDCFVLWRQTQTADQEIVAYVVLNGPFSSERLWNHLQSECPGTPLPSVVFVPISYIPLTDAGTVDVEVLVQMAVVDDELAQQWEAQLKSQADVDQVAVVIQGHHPVIPPLHRSDLVPDWKANQAEVLQAIAPDDFATDMDQPDSTPKPLSISDGGTLILEPDAPTNLAEVLARAATLSPDRGMLYLRLDGTETRQSYPALLEEAERILAGLRQLGLQPQDKVLFQLDDNQDLIPAFWACVLGGFVPVPISAAPVYDPNNSVVKKLVNAWQRLDHPVILAPERLVANIRALSNQLEAVDLRVEPIEQLRSRDRATDHHPSQPDDLALLLLTSGSTGIPKGVTLRHRNLIHSIAGTSQQSHFTRDDVFLNWLPLDHPGPMIRCVIRPVYLGAQDIHAPTAAILADPLKWFDWIEKYQVTSAWAPNFAYALVNDRAEAIKQRHWDLSCVRSMLSTAEPIMPQTSRKFLELMAPNGLVPTAMHSSWGMAETSSGVTSCDRYLVDPPGPHGDSFADLGSPIPGITLRIVDDQNELVPEGTIGYLQLKGETVTGGYYQNPEMNAEVFVDGWFKTGDLGFLHQGRLTITGRTKDIIIINGSNYYTHEIEAVVEEVAGIEVSYTAACATRPVGSDTDQLILFFHTAIANDDRLRALLKQIQTVVVRKIGITPSYLLPVAKETIPKTSIGKIQRSQLKQQFEAGEFNEIVKRTDLLLENDNTLPDWFYRKLWRSRAIDLMDPQPRTGQTLVFLDALGLGESLIQHLQNQGQSCVGIVAGPEFTQLAGDRYAIDPRNPDHYHQILTAIAEPERPPIHQVLHLWTYSAYEGEADDITALETAQDYGTYSLLFLVQTLDQISNRHETVRLGVISSHVQPVDPDDAIAYEKSSILGLVKTFPRELPWLDAVHIDIPANTPTNVTTLIQSELAALPREREVAYRQGQRFIPRLEPAELLQQPRQPLPFKSGGMYLLSGGLGGIGVEIARYLLQTYGAHLLLIGQTPLPDRNTWQTHLAAGGKVAERIQSYLELEQLGGAIAYEAVDIGNLDQLRTVVERMQSQWGETLHGVIHLAGISPKRLLLDETHDSLAKVLYPKLHGTWALYQLVHETPEAVFISFSSVLSFFAGATFGAYSAANNLLDCFHAHQSRQQTVQTYCFCSGNWDDVGLSRGNQGKEATRAQGYYAMSVDQGLTSLLAAIHHHQEQIIVGLDGSSSFMLPVIETRSQPTQVLNAYVTGSANGAGVKSNHEFEHLEIRDRFGIPTTCHIHQLEELPLTDSGEIDREQLIAIARGIQAERIPPRDDLERQLVEIWQSVLGTTSIGVTDNFFELGGSSLLAIQLFGAIEQELGKNLPLATLFEAPTIEKLATILRPSDAAPTGLDSVVQIRAGGSKTPLFFIHDADGETILYLKLANHLDPDRPIYGLRPYSRHGFPMLHTRISDMADYYLERIRQIQPHGPYFLGGLCAGGTIAFEVACRLQAQGEDAPLVALMDAGDFHVPRRAGLVARKRFSRIGQTLSDAGHQSALTGVVYLVKTLTKKARNLVVYEVSRRVFKLQIESRIKLLQFCLDRNLTPPKFLRDIPIRALFKFAADRHTPTVYQGQMLLFRATETIWKDKPNIDDTPMSERVIDPHFGWLKRATDGVEAIDVPGGHSTMLQEPNVQVITERLETFLREHG